MSAAQKEPRSCGNCGSSDLSAERDGGRHLITCQDCGKFAIAASEENAWRMIRADDSQRATEEAGDAIERLRAALDEFCGAWPWDPLGVVDAVATVTVGALDRIARSTGKDLLGSDLRKARRLLGLLNTTIFENSLRGEEAEDE